MKSTSVHRYKAAVFGLVGLAALLAVGAAVRYWLPPWAPLAAYAALGVAPLVFWAGVGALVFDPTKTKDALVTKDSPPTAERLRMALAPVGVAVAFGALFPAVWFSSGARLMATELAASQGLNEPLVAAFRDQSPEVRLSACRGITDLGGDGALDMVGGLADPVEEIVDCVLTAMPASERAPLALEGLSSRWHRELMTLEEQQGAGDRACQLADRLRLAEHRGVKRAPVQLMQCSLDAESAPARGCCGQAFRALLGGSDVEPSMVMPTPEELAAIGFSSAVPSLLAATFPKDAQAEQRRGELRLGTPTTATWSLAVACESLEVGAKWREPVSSAIVQAISTPQCPLEPATETTVRVWTAVCDKLFTEEKLRTATPEDPATFCLTLQGALTADAINTARHEALRAMRIAHEPNRRAEMLQALLDYSANRAAQMDLGKNPQPTGMAPKKNKRFMSLFFQPEVAGESRMETMFRMMGGSPDLMKKDGESTDEYMRRYAAEQKKQKDDALQLPEPPKLGVMNLFD